MALLGRPHAPRRGTLQRDAREIVPRKLSAHHIAKLVALVIACPKELNDLRKRAGFELLKDNRECPDASQREIQVMLDYQSHHGAAYNLESAPLRLYFYLG